MSEPQLCREIGSLVAFHSADTFIGKVDGNSETGLFHKKPLDFVQCPGMFRRRPDIFIVGRRQTPLPESVQVLVYRSYTVFPYPVFPVRLRQVIGQHSAVAVQCHHLACLLFESHPGEKVFHPVGNIGGRIFVNIHDAVLIEIYPAFMIDAGIVLRMQGQ